MAKRQVEFHLQKQVCQYLRSQYPELLFSSDTIAAVSLTMPQAVRNKAVQKEGFKMPDLCIWKPVGKYAGLMIELKKESPFLEGGVTLSRDKHIQEQWKTMQQLNELGYVACWAWTFDMAKDIIDNYLKGSL